MESCLHEQRPKLYGVRLMCRRRAFVGLSALLSMCVVGDATAQTSGANWLEQLFRAPQHVPPSFARPGVSTSRRSTRKRDREQALFRSELGKLTAKVMRKLHSAKRQLSTERRTP
jgi:hypothetical protein